VYGANEKASIHKSINLSALEEPSAVNLDVFLGNDSAIKNYQEFDIYI
jgi:hypothetical protein